MVDPDEGTELEPRRGAWASSPDAERPAPHWGDGSWELPPTPEIRRHSPIGALPGAAEPPPHARWTELLGDARRYVGMIRSGARDVGTAAFKLARLPVDIALMAAHKVRPLKA
jgi:hypothetical protein